MKKHQLILVFIIIAIVIASCSNKETVEYYDNGNIKISYFLNNGNINGLYKLYDEDGQAKEIHIYDHNKMIDSSMFFYSNQIPLRKRRQITWSDSVGVDINYNKKEIITSKGMISKEDVNRKNWKMGILWKRPG